MVSPELLNNGLDKGIDYLSSLSSFSGAIKWATPSWDLFLFTAYAGAVLFLVFSFSRAKLPLMLLSIYVSVVLMNCLSPLSNWLNQKSSLSYLWRIVIFLIVFLIVYNLVSRLSLFSGAGLGSFWQTILFGFFLVGLFISIIFSFLPSQILNHFMILTQNIFVNEPARSLWLILPILSLVFVRRRF